MSPLQWRVRPVLPIAKLLGAVALVVLVVAFGRDDPVQWFIAIAVGAVLIGWAARDLVVPVRLSADTSGIILVTGFARRRHVAWPQVERVRVDRRERLGLRNAFLEIDTGESLHLLSVHELGTDPEEVAAALNALRSNAPL
ncbi:PH domain-containing protein [Actinoplanes sp. NPDC049599]|uniref:PH domain-containing protein n=1 Tax=Actinoplanes sp. NPDC049599 TaxID=3363903 RepID=UPI003789CCAD